MKPEGEKFASEGVFPARVSGWYVHREDGDADGSRKGGHRRGGASKPVGDLAPITSTCDESQSAPIRVAQLLQGGVPELRRGAGEREPDEASARLCAAQ